MIVNENHLKARALATLLLERDDIGKLPLPPSAKRYARMKSDILFKDKGQAKEKLYIDMAADVSGQSDKKQGFKNYDGSAFTSRRRRKMEGATADFLRKHGISRTREIRVERDPDHESYLAIPVFENPGRWMNLFKVDPEEASMKQKLKDRLSWLARYRKGYRPGDVFVSQLGRFLVTDVMGIKEI